MKQREIKFRAYCDKHQRWEIYSLGDLVSGAAISANGEGGIFSQWSEYTGINDKENNPIFEGDVVVYFTNTMRNKPKQVKWISALNTVGFNITDINRKTGGKRQGSYQITNSNASSAAPEHHKDN